MKKWVFVSVGFFVLMIMNVYAGDLSTEDAEVMDATGIPIYPNDKKTYNFAQGFREKNERKMEKAVLRRAFTKNW